MKHCGKAASGLGLILLTGLCGCQLRMNSPASGDSGKVDIHIDAKENESGFSLNIKGDFGKTVSQKVEETYNAANVKTLKVTETSGSVAVTAQVGGSDEISITAYKRVNGEEAESKLRPYLNYIKPMIKLTDGVLEIYTEREEKQFEKRGGWIDYEIRVPKRIASQIKVSSGDVKLEGMEGGVTVEASSGEIELERLGGKVIAKAASGDITIKDAELTERLELETSSGEITAEGIRARNNALAVSLTASSGDIQYEGDASALSVKTSSGSQTLTLLSSPDLKEINARASSGNIEMNLPKSLKSSLTLNTSSGNIDLNGTDNDESDEKEVKTTIGGGGSPVSLQTTSGNLTVEVK